METGASGSRQPLRRQTLRAAFGTMAATSAAPYGYTVSVWSSGAMLMHHHGTPGVAEVFTFAAGALAGYGVIALLAYRAALHTEQLERAGDRVLAGAMHWAAVGMAVGAAALLARIHGWPAWPLASFAATALYLLGASAQLALVATRSSS